MIQYSALAHVYDELTTDVPYEKMAQFARKSFELYGNKTELVLEVGCGTGSLSRILAQDGFEMICCDISAEMLEVARAKCEELSPKPIFICQDMCELDLFGTVDAAVCGLDSLNYLTSLRELKAAIGRVSLFLNKGGIFVFDIKTREGFMKTNGMSCVEQGAGYFCTWQYGFDCKSGYAEHEVDIFLPQKDGSYLRETEIHQQRAYSREQIEQAIKQAGLKIKKTCASPSFGKIQQNSDRLFYITEKI